MKNHSQEIKRILKLPYHHVVVPDTETGTYTALIQEFPGCIAQGSSQSKALEALKSAAESWLEAALDMKLTIPTPAFEPEYSGKIALRISRSYHAQAIKAAERDGISLNQFLAGAIAEKLGSERPSQISARRVTRGPLTVLPTKKAPRS